MTMCAKARSLVLRPSALVRSWSLVLGPSAVLSPWSGSVVRIRRLGLGPGPLGVVSVYQGPGANDGQRANDRGRTSGQGRGSQDYASAGAARPGHAGGLNRPTLRRCRRETSWPFLALRLLRAGKMAPASQTARTTEGQS